MAKVSTVQTDVVDTKVAEAPFQMPDAESTAEVVLNEGLAFCARKMGLKDHQAVVDHLQKGDDKACEYCRYGLAKKAAESIGWLDENVQVAYVLDYDATPLDLCYGHQSHTSMIHLIVQVERKTKALESLVAALDRALAKKYAELINAPKLAHLLDVQIVDETEVRNRTGYGALLSSIHSSPIQVWER